MSKQSMLDWDIEKVRQDFPILQKNSKGSALVYLDNASTTQKPKAVMAAMQHYYEAENANVHRGIYALSEQATAHFEGVRRLVQRFINAKSSHEIVFVKGTTEAINLVAQSYGRSVFKAGDEVILSTMEHHANIVPWQLLSKELGITIRVLPINEKGELELEQLPGLFNKKTKLLAITHASNALGTINPAKKIIEIAHAHNVPVLLDGAQSVLHSRIDVQELDCDFFAFSGHKMYGPTGTGVLYAKQAILEKMPPYQGGGDMIKMVTFEHTEFNELPYKFEAGTPNIAGVIGLGAAIEYLNSLGLDRIRAYETELLHYATHSLKQINGLRIIGNAEHKAPIISFELEDIHPHDIGSIVDHSGVALRAGHHCAMPLMQFFKVAATARVSFGLYNSFAEIDALVNALRHVQELFAHE
ncbi:MAG: cysteine sulfinate desulfinase [Gammaproteobacteria bacterium]|jgi:cysteine desulfurase/selenocysteine lyase|nr:cysteine sulfinate desulfinase [Gammaproteobacteria bacterium]